MGRLNIFVVTLISVALLYKSVHSLDFCGAEDIPKCDRNDQSCVKEKLEPGLRKWFLKGQPGYFMEPLDPMTFEELPIPTKKGLYKLKNISLSGFSEAKFGESVTDFEKQILKYSYDYKFDLTAEQFVDQNGQTLLDASPLLIHLENLYVATHTDFVIVERCKNQYVKFTKSEADVRDVKDEDVNIKSDLTIGDSELKHTIAHVVGKAATRKIAENYRTLAKLVPISAFYN